MSYPAFKKNLKKYTCLILIVAVLSLGLFPLSEAKAAGPSNCCEEWETPTNVHGGELTPQIFKDILVPFIKDSLENLVPGSIRANIETIVAGCHFSLLYCDYTSHAYEGITLDDFLTITLPEKVHDKILSLLPGPDNHSSEVWSPRGIQIKYPSSCEMKIPLYESPNMPPEKEEDCYKLKQVYDSAFVVAAAAKKIVDLTDPFGKGSIIRNCQTNCYIGLSDKPLLTIGGESCISIIEWALAILSFGIYPAIKLIRTIAEIAKLLNEIMKKVRNIQAKIEKIKKMVETLKKIKEDIENIDFSNISLSGIINLKSHLDELSDDIAKTKEKMDEAKTKIKEISDKIASTSNPLAGILESDFQKIRNFTDDLENATDSPAYLENISIVSNVKNLDYILSQNSATSDIAAYLNAATTSYSAYLEEASTTKCCEPIDPYSIGSAEELEDYGFDVGGYEGSGSSGEASPLSMSLNDQIDQLNKYIEHARKVKNALDNLFAALGNLQNETNRIKNDIIPNFSSDSDKNSAQGSVSSIQAKISNIENIEFKRVYESASEASEIDTSSITQDDIDTYNTFEEGASTTKATLEKVINKLNEQEKALSEIGGFSDNDSQKINAINTKIENAKTDFSNASSTLLTLGISEDNMKEVETSITEAQTNLSTVSDDSDKVNDAMHEIGNVFTGISTVEDVLHLKDQVENFDFNLSGDTSSDTSSDSEEGSSESASSDTSSDSGEGSSESASSDASSDSGEGSSESLSKYEAAFSYLRCHSYPCTGYRGTFNVFPSLNSAVGLTAAAVKMELIASDIRDSDIREDARDIANNALIVFILTQLLKKTTDRVSCGQSEICNIPFCISGACFCFDAFKDKNYWFALALREGINKFSGDILDQIKP